MVKGYKNNERLKEYIGNNLDKIGIDESFKPLIVDVMLRRFSEFDFSPQEIYADMTALVNNLKTIEVGKMPQQYNTAAGLYYSDSKKILIAEDCIKNAKTQEDFETLYEIFTHELFHSLARDKDGNPKISTANKYTNVAYFSLEEAIVEKAADRCVFGRTFNEGNAPFFHQNQFGYNDITYITDIIEASYGVTEKAFLRNAIQGRKYAEEFLAAIAGEKEEESLDFLDRIELNYTTLHHALYDKNVTQKNRVSMVKDGMIAGLLVSSWKLSENIERLDVNAQNFEERIENFKYGHNKMYLVTKDAAKKFDYRFPFANISKEVFDAIHDTREDNSFRINVLSNILKNRANIPENDFVKLVEAAKTGKRDFGEEENLYEKYEINLDAPEYIPLESDSYLGFRYMDFETTNWDNSQLPEELRNVFNVPEKSDINFLDKIKEMFEKAKKYMTGKNKEPKALGPGKEENDHPKQSSSWGQLSEEDMEKFNKGMENVLKQRNKREQEVDANAIKYEDTERDGLE